MHKILTLWFPLLVLAAQLLMEMTFSGNEKAVLMSENGPVELLQFIVIVSACAVAGMTLFKISLKTNAALFGWVLMAAFACFYIGGEEVSWGQHFLNWDTPAYWQAINDQHETNFHNMTSWLDQKPRLVLFLGIVVGGLVFPVLQKFKPGTLPEKFSVVYPPAFLVPVALLVTGPYLVQEIAEHFFQRGVFQRVSEVQELYMYYFVLLYLMALHRRIIDQARP
jgi:hypothetical protein